MISFRVIVECPAWWLRSNNLNAQTGNRRFALDTPERLSALECLRVIAVARLMMPAKEIRVCGGRETNLRDLQSWTLICGADGLIIEVHPKPEEVSPPR